MIIVCPTVPHTGTHFIRDLLLDAPREPWIERVLVAHPYEDNLGGFEQLIDDGNPVIIPVRALDAVMASWKKYGKDLANYAGRSLLEWFQIQDGLVLRAMQNAKLFHLNLDQPGIRSLQLYQINLKLGLNLETDWKPVRQPGANE